MTTCRAFIRRVRPQGYNILCNKTATHEIVAIHMVDGKEILHGEYCEKHAHKAMGTYAKAAGWEISIRAIVRA